MGVLEDADVGTEDHAASRFGMLEVEQAPESPGIYAWYVTFQASAQDWETKPVDGQDASIEGFLGLLREYASYYEPLPITLHGSAPYGGRWDGALELDHGVNRRETTSVPEGTDRERERRERDREALDNTISSQTGRRLLAQFLGRATPVFSSPLYIGVAENLNERLQQHRSNYNRAMDWLRGNPNDADRLKRDAKNFGQRAAARGIAMENLEAWVIDLKSLESDISVRSLRESAQSAEWLLHRLFAPILGRQ
ncbi:hypothetical protein ACH4UM_06745 [Streptomyces sp. NPDC020801]|uniref:hypothetical protein n=1 Tax=Streptomyces sp. NPDC020801 TaxID=3365093 RepID=UPI0037B68B8D